MKYRIIDHQGPAHHRDIEVEINIGTPPLIVHVEVSDWYLPLDQALTPSVAERIMDWVSQAAGIRHGCVAFVGNEHGQYPAQPRILIREKS